MNRKVALVITLSLIFWGSCHIICSYPTLVNQVMAG